MKISDRRMIFLAAVLSVWAIAVVARLVQIQIVRNSYYVSKAARQQERTIELTPVRGSLRDARGRILAESVEAESIYADPQAVADKKRTAAKLAQIPTLGSAKEIAKRLSGNGEFAWVARQVSPETAAAVRKLSLPGIYLLSEHKRSYPKGHLAANVIGYVGVDGKGLAGVEHSFNEWVRGKSGKITLLRDARRGTYLVDRQQGVAAAEDGKHVVLTIDQVIQFISEKTLEETVTKYRAASGSVIVLDPNDGSVLAMASFPSFDPNEYRKASPDAWRNRVVQDRYEPGSTFKIITAAAGLEEGKVTPSQIIDCEMGGINIGRFRIREHGDERYGLISFEDVLAHSSNVGTIKVGLALGKSGLYQWTRKFGFGERTGIELPGEAAGILRPTEKWSLLSNASISIGQEIGATPLQVALATAAVANGGVLLAPRIVDKVIDDRGNVVHSVKREESRRVISERTAAVLNEMLKTVVVRGTGKAAQLPEHVVAGKTGTAQKAGRGGYSNDVIASFAGYVPADRPRLVILVAIDSPKTAQYGGVIAAPAFRQIAEASLRYLDVPPSVPARELQIDGLKLASLNPAIPARKRGGVVVVPDLTGLDARQAFARATAAGLELRADGRGVVALQQPPAGTVVKPGARLEIRLSTGVGA